MPTDQGNMRSTADWLRALGLDKYVELFSEQEIDLDLLPELTDEDLEKLGIPLQPLWMFFFPLENLYQVVYNIP